MFGFGTKQINQAGKQPRSAPTASPPSLHEQSERPNDLKSVSYKYIETKVNKGAPLGFDTKLPSGIVTRTPSDAYNQGVREGYTLHTVNAKEVPKDQTKFNNMIEKMTKQNSGQEWNLEFSRPYRPRVLVNLQEPTGFRIDKSGFVKDKPNGQCKGKVRGRSGGGADQLCWVGTQEDENQPDSKWTWHRMTDLNNWNWETMKTHLVEKKTRALLLFRSKERGLQSDTKNNVLAKLQILCNHGRSILQYRTLLQDAVSRGKRGKEPKDDIIEECPSTMQSLAQLTWLWRRSSQPIIKSVQDNLIKSIREVLQQLGVDQKKFLEQFHRDVVLRAIVASARLWKMSVSALSTDKSEQRQVLEDLMRASKDRKLDTATRFLILDQLGYELDEKKRGELLRMPAHPSDSNHYLIPSDELCNFPDEIKLKTPTGVGSVKEICEVTYITTTHC
jgi:hypothetical protein